MLSITRLPGPAADVSVSLEELGSVVDPDKPLPDKKLRMEANVETTTVPLGVLGEGGFSATVRIGSAPPTRFDFACERGYVRHGDTCRTVPVPSNAYLDNSGDGWRCDRRYAPLNDGCARIDVPPRAHLDYSGNDWRCESGLRRDVEVQERGAPAQLADQLGAVLGKNQSG